MDLTVSLKSTLSGVAVHSSYVVTSSEPSLQDGEEILNEVSTGAHGGIFTAFNIHPSSRRLNANFIRALEPLPKSRRGRLLQEPLIQRWIPAEMDLGLPPVP
jgi:hypothetical protein